MMISMPWILARRAAVLLLAGASAAAAQPGGDVRPPVMGWIPAHGIDDAGRALAATPAAGRALTRLGLQFWNPSPDGTGVVLAPQDASGKPVTPAQVRQLQGWARAHGVVPLLTVSNNSAVMERWDWPLARRAFVDHPEEFAAALVAAVEAWDLGGVDLDLEGEGDHETDRAAYASFVHLLGAALKARGKLLTVDSFPSPCADAPNLGWWADWVGAAQAVHSLGYADLYEGNLGSFTPEGRPSCEGGAALFRYSWQVDYGLRAGWRRDQIVLGMPTWLDRWGAGGAGPSLVDHLREVRALGAGVGLGDLQLAAPGWTRPAAWDAVQAVRRPPPARWAALHGGGAGGRTRARADVHLNAAR